MADATDDLRADLERQIAEMRKEMSKLGKSLAARASDAMDEAGEVYENTRGRARQTAKQMREQAHMAADVARENPGTTATVLMTVGLIGLLAGMAIGKGFAGGDRH